MPSSVSQQDLPQKSPASTKLRVVVFDQEINRVRRPAFEDDHIVTGILHLVAEEAAGVGAGDGAGQGALGDRPNSGRRSTRRCPSSGPVAMIILLSGESGSTLRIGLLHQVLGRQTALTKVASAPNPCSTVRAVQVPFGQVDPQYLFLAQDMSRFSSCLNASACDAGIGPGCPLPASCRSRSMLASM